MNNTETGNTSNLHKESNRKQRQEGENQNPPSDQDPDESNDDKEIRDENTPNSGRHIVPGSSSCYQTTTKPAIQKIGIKVPG